MNFRITTFFFGLLLTMLWVFGLMIAHKKTAVDQSLIMPSLSDAKVDDITVARSEKDKDGKRKELPGVHFVKKGEDWYLKEEGQETRIENFQVTKIIDQVRDLKPEEDADVSKEPAFYGMDHPELVAVFKGKDKAGEAKEWKFTLGRTSPDFVAYVGSSERGDKVFAVARKSIEGLLFDNPNYLRSKRLFEFLDPAVSEVIARQGAKELELKRNDLSTWVFVKPPLGFAGPENPPAPEEKKKPFQPPKAKAEEGIRGVKALLDAIKNIRVEEDADFVPLGKPASSYGLEAGKENARIEVHLNKDKEKPKEVSKETLLIGKEAPARKQARYYYARLANDEGVFELNAKQIDPVLQAIAEPGKIRSLDIAAYDPKTIDAVVVKQGKDEVKLLRPDSKPNPEAFPRPNRDENWQMYLGNERKTGNRVAIDKLIEQCLGKGAIVKFIDEPNEAAWKKFDAEAGLDKPAAEISFYASAVESAKKDEKKDEKDKSKTETKDEKKGPALALKSDAKPLVTLAIGKTDKDLVYVRRTLQDGATVSRFTLKKEFVDKIMPPDGPALAYLDTTLPESPADNSSAMTITRQTDKGMEKLEFQQRLVDGRGTWFVKDPLAKSGFQRASESVPQLVRGLSALAVKKWVKKIGDKEDLDKYGLKNPVVTVAINYKKLPVANNSPLSMIGAFIGDPLAFAGALGLIAQQEIDPGETITLEFGKETDVEADKPGVFGKQSKTDLLFLVDPRLEQELKTHDFYDRTAMLYAQAEIEAIIKGSAGISPINLLMLASPYFAGQVMNFEPDKVKEVRLAVRTPYELRSFTFEKNAKDKTWSDKSNLFEFKLDSDKVVQLVKEIAKLRTDRFVAFAGGPRSEHKLGARESNVKLDLTTEDGKAITLLVGARYQNQGYFATTSTWPETVFFVPAAVIDPLLRGVPYFAKERALGQ